MFRNILSNITLMTMFVNSQVIIEEVRHVFVYRADRFPESGMACTEVVNLPTNRNHGSEYARMGQRCLFAAGACCLPLRLWQ